MLGPKRRTLSKSETAERSQKLIEFLAKPEIKEAIQQLKPHKRVVWIRTEFEKETNIKIPVSSIYKFLRDMEKNNEPAPVEEPETKTEE